MALNLQPAMLSASERREQIRQKTITGLKDLFPLIGKNSTLDIRNIAIKRKEYSTNEQKDALMSGRTLHEPIQATLVLKDNKTGKVLDEKQRTLLHLPYFTQRYTFIVGGNEYDIPSQLRLKPGVYTRERNNGEFEAAFNLSKGDNFRIAMEPESGKIHMELDASKIPLYPLLRSLGATDTEIKNYWGAELKDVNATLGKDKEEVVLNKIINKIKRAGDAVPGTLEGKRDFVRNYFENTAMDGEVNERTLGKPVTKANALALLTASKKLIDVHRGHAKGDDRDSLEFKTMHGVEDFFRERLDKEARRTISKKIVARLNQSKTNDIGTIVPNSAFSKSINMFLTNAALSSQPAQINPVEIIDYASKVTSLGEGGMSSERQVTNESRKIHNTHFGILDPVRTPETGRAGIDVRSSLAAFKDEKGNLYSLMQDAKTGKMTHVPVMTLAKSVVAFPRQDHRKLLDAFKNGDIHSVQRKDVDYILPDPTYMLSPATALVPLLNGMQGNRSMMGAKFQTQALPLVDREAPFVQAAAPRKGQSMEREVARLVVPTSPVDGTIDKIDDDYIYIRPSAKTAAAASDLVKLPYDSYFPLASKTYLHNEIKVKPGHVVKQDQMLAESNFTKDGTLALGKNLSVAYLAYYGKNSNDAVVISEDAAKKLTSEHMYKESLPKTSDVVTGKDKYRAYYGMRFTQAQLDKLDENGVAKKGAILAKGDPLILALRKAAPTPEATLLGNFHKSLVKPYRDATITWDKVTPCVVQDAVNAARQIMVTVRTQEPMKIGDKLSNRFGGKGVVSEIIPTNRMVRDESGKPIDVLFTSAGIVSRINPAQVVEAALGKVAEKTGKPIILPQFHSDDNVQFAKKLLKEHGVKDKETVYDPISDREIKDIFVGRSYIHKLFKSTETNYAARGVSDYDINQQPTRGGEEGAKGLGKMEINALLAHNARNVLKEALTLKSEKSDAFWRAYEFGLPTPPPKTPFVSEKLVSMLQGAGINVNKQGTLVSLAPMTDTEVTKISAGGLSVPSLEKSKSFMVNAKNMAPETGGLFDPNLTGGMSGTKWAHIDLTEPIVNPVFEDSVRRLLDLSKKKLKDEINTIGGEGIKNKLNALNLDQLEKDLLAKSKTARGPELDNVVKKIKYIRALKAAGHTKAGDAYTLSKLPVIPPVMRPILPSARGNELQVSDINYLYRDAALASVALANAKETEVPTLVQNARAHLHDTTSALFGLTTPTSPQLQGRDVKGFIEQIAGSGSPKSGFLHKKVLKRQQDLTGRATATPDNTLDIDQIGIPEDMLWTTYSKFIMRGLISQGYKPLDAQKMIEERHPAAKTVLDQETKQRPVFVNRAPSLHKHNFVAAYPVPVSGKSLRVNPFMERGQNLDYDGDAMQIHVPVTTKAVEEARKLTLSNLLFTDSHADDLVIFPQHEALLGTYLATKPQVTSAVRKFKTKKEAMDAYHRGEITMNTPVEILELT
jgi:DNA-directed RNA polymerase subunit beta